MEMIHQGQVLRADRVVEFFDEIWILDYKCQELPIELPHYREQVTGYCQTLSATRPDKPIRAMWGMSVQDIVRVAHSGPWYGACQCCL